MPSRLPPLEHTKVHLMKPVLQPPPVVTYRGSFCARHLETHGPVSVQALVGRYDEATWQLLTRLGYGPRRMANERRGWMALEQKIVHLEELRAASVLHIETDLLELGESRLRCLHRMRDSESQRTLSTMELTFVLVGSDEGSSTGLPADLIQRARAVFPQLPRRALAPAPAPTAGEPTALPA
jgi:acyl-CoA thioesterase FadM